MSSAPLAFRGNILFGTHFEPGTVVAEGGRIVDVIRVHLRDGNLPPAVFDVDYVTPGMIDLQVNGAVGVGADGSAANVEQISRWSLASGVTGWLPTIVTAGASLYPRVFGAFRDVDRSIGATPLGLHLEGPFLSPARKGAHVLKFIEDASDELFDSWLGEPDIRLVTLAPEREGGIDRIRRLVDRGVVVSLGHTDATLEEFAAGVDAGATKATHLFNAMSPMHHRAPGAMIATMLDDRVTAGIIPDAVHSHPATVRLAIRAKGPDRLAVVSDMMSATGMGPGTYDLGRQRVHVTETTARLENGTLAGSVLTMDQAVRNLVAWGEVTPAIAVHMATRVPADLIHESERGRIVAGARADLALWDRDLRIMHTVLAGEVAWTAPGD
ncbi:MAG TPA: N-acetylglucosamine-6-phosphate deacetylase [Thermomicrobiales bacterium]|nr:N-acetylglucosamine-6-phosphate deacetylase [Thermomicrobiales bacterium]